MVIIIGLIGTLIGAVVGAARIFIEGSDLPPLQIMLKGIATGLLISVAAGAMEHLVFSERINRHSFTGKLM